MILKRSSSMQSQGILIIFVRLLSSKSMIANRTFGICFVVLLVQVGLVDKDTIVKTKRMQLTPGDMATMRRIETAVGEVFDLPHTWPMQLATTLGSLKDLTCTGLVVSQTDVSTIFFCLSPRVCISIQQRSHHNRQNQKANGQVLVFLTFATG